MAITKHEITNMIYEHISIPKTEYMGIVGSLFENIKSELEAEGSSVTYQ
jgi:nucleoid DNA-binding protein